MVIHCRLVINWTHGSIFRDIWFKSRTLCIEENQFENALCETVTIFFSASVSWTRLRSSWGHEWKGWNWDSRHRHFPTRILSWSLDFQGPMEIHYYKKINATSLCTNCLQKVTLFLLSPLSSSPSHSLPLPLYIYISIYIYTFTAISMYIFICT